MKINTTTLQSLDTSKSYYLSDTGEIKQSGFTQWFKCLFNIDIGRVLFDKLLCGSFINNIFGFPFVVVGIFAIAEYEYK